MCSGSKDVINGAGVLQNQSMLNGTDMFQNRNPLNGDKWSQKLLSEASVFCVAGQLKSESAISQILHNILDFCGQRSQLHEES